VQLQNNYSANGSTTIGGPRSYFELPPASGSNTRDNVSAPPNTIVISLSSPIPYPDYSNALQLIRSADSASSPADGDFGTLGQGGLGSTGTGFTAMSGVTVSLYNDGVLVPAPQPGQPTPTGNQLVLSVSGTLPADYYRI